VSFLSNIEFLNPEFFILLLAIPAIAAWYWFKKVDTEVSFTLSSIESIADITTWRTWLHKLMPLLRMLSYIFIVIAIARPQITLKEEEVKAEGIDIMMIMDLSSSMLAQDFRPELNVL